MGIGSFALKARSDTKNFKWNAVYLVEFENGNCAASEEPLQILMENWKQGTSSWSVCHEKLWGMLGFIVYLLDQGGAALMWLSIYSSPYLNLLLLLLNLWLGLHSKYFLFFSFILYHDLLVAQSLAFSSLHM